MADTTKQISGAVEPYYEYAKQAVDEQAILDKYNAATAAQFAAQREQNRIAENQFYNQMYNTQKTAMDTIRQSNAAAVASGASRGVQAAQELSSLLGLQQESVASATELAQANRQTAQEETAAMLENVLNAYTQAQQERSALVQQGIEAQSLGATESEAQTKHDQYMLDLKVNDPDAYNREIAIQNNASDFTNMTDKQYTLNTQVLTSAVADVVSQVDYNFNDYAVLDFGTSGDAKTRTIDNSIINLYKSYGLTEEQAKTDLKELSAHMNKLIGSAPSVGQLKNRLKTFMTNRIVERYKTAYESSKI